MTAFGWCTRREWTLEIELALSARTFRFESAPRELFDEAVAMIALNLYSPIDDGPARAALLLELCRKLFEFVRREPQPRDD